MQEAMPQRHVVLLIDDDPGDHELTRRALSGGPPDVDLRIVSDGREALEYLRREGRYAGKEDVPAPDLVLLDLNMPGLDGRKVLQALRACEDLRGIPVVVLTTSSRPEDMVVCEEAGGDAFVTKPANLGAFMRTVRGVVRHWLSKPAGAAR